MKVNQKLHQAKLAKWGTLLQDQASSGLPVKEWCAQNDVTVHAYYFWKRLAKEAYINSIIPEIVPFPAVQIQESPSCSSDQPSFLRRSWSMSTMSMSMLQRITTELW